MFIRSTEDVDQYFHTWKEDIGATIYLNDNNKTIANYPKIEAAFDRMEKAWRDAFDANDKDFAAYIELSSKRDNAIQELGKIIATEIK